MKKCYLGIMAVAGLMATSFAFAETQNTAGYVTGQVNLASAPVSIAKPGLRAAATVMGMQPTNMVVINFSNYRMHVRIEGLTVDQWIDAGAPALFTNSAYRSDRFMFLDEYNRVIIRDHNNGEYIPICRRAIVTIDGGPDYYNMKVEDKYCR
jgi:hypothetical protein